MIDLVRSLLRGQLDAALATLNHPIVHCPDETWNAPIANLAFCQAAFHAIFFTDYYLGPDPGALRDQAFHLAHPDYFRDYEELVDRPQTHLYDRPTTLAYLRHCRDKAAAAVAAETEASLAATAAFGRPITRAELYVYVLRHLQHHAAQLGLRLRLDHGIDLPWFGSGWRDA